MKRDPRYALLLAVAEATLGFYLLTHNSLAVGAFMWWACGVNCAVIFKSIEAVNKQ